MNTFAMTVGPEEAITVALTGDWSIIHGLPPLAEIRQSFTPGGKVRQITIDAIKLGKWDSSLLTFLFSIEAICREHGARLDFGNLPQDASGLVRLALSDQPPTNTPQEKIRRSSVAFGALTPSGMLPGWGRLPPPQSFQEFLPSSWPTRSSPLF